MRARDIDKIGHEIEQLYDLVDRIDRKVDRIELVTVVREPNTQVAGDAYSGLRKQVIAAVGERNAHLHQLAQFSAALAAGASPEELSALVTEWLGQASITLLDDPAVAEAFEFVGPEDGTGRRVRQPAYVDQLTGRVVRSGVIERVAEVPVEQELDESAEEPMPTTGGDR